MHYHKMNPNQSIRVHFLVAVNPVHGPLYLEFTTGTTNIQRRNYTHAPYKCKGKKKKKAKSTTQEEFEDNMRLLAAQLSKLSNSGMGQGGGLCSYMITARFKTRRGTLQAS